MVAFPPRLDPLDKQPYCYSTELHALYPDCGKSRGDLRHGREVTEADNRRILRDAVSQMQKLRNHGQCQAVVGAEECGRLNTVLFEGKEGLYEPTLFVEFKPVQTDSLMSLDFNLCSMKAFETAAIARCASHKGNAAMAEPDQMARDSLAGLMASPGDLIHG